MRHAIFGTVMLFATSASVSILPAAMLPIKGDPVMIESGRVAGTRLASGVRAYLGIPFAEPPVGQRRWRAPQPIRWDGVWNADRRGPECIQVLRPHNINHYFGEEPTGEDCLYLNLWTPARAPSAAKLPVIVFMYGGGFTIGSSGMSNYDGEQVAKAGAVFVNFNYRVGAFGFLAHPELSREQGGHSGDYGIMDQIAALGWVRANVAKFGGDPGKVLIVGQSAGAMSVETLLFSPRSAGLFRAAAMSSGCGLAPEDTPLATAEQTGVEMQRALGASDLSAMRDVPADRILAAQTETQVGVHVQGVRIGGPIVDGYILPEPKKRLLAEHRIARAPIIASYNGDDIDQGGNPFAKARTVADYRDIAARTFGADSAAFLALFPASTDAEVVPTARRVGSMAGLEGAARQCAIGEAEQGNAAYLDLFAHKHPYAPGVRLADQDPATIGAYHTADIPYWFGTLDKYNLLRRTRVWTDWDRALSDRMMRALIAFAATGRPGTPSQPWPAWSRADEVSLTFGDRVTADKLDVKRIEWLRAHPFPKLAPAARRIRD